MLSRRAFIGGTLSMGTLRGADAGAVWMNIREAGSLLRSKRVSCADLTRLCLSQVQRLNAELNAFVTLTPERAVEQARVLEAEASQGRWRGPLHGIPIALKDLYDTRGVRTTAGSKQWFERVPSRDADVVTRLVEAGAIVLGKLNMDEFAYNFTGETSAFGTSRNPWDRERSPGGSSGGSAVAVATGMCFAALGSDTGGSIRLPAALCGVTGLKPTYGVVSTEGVAPLAWSLDHVGPMCRTAGDTGIMLEALAGRPVPYLAVNVRALRMGVPRTLFYEELDPEVARAVAEATRVLANVTAGSRDTVLPRIERSSNIRDLPAFYTDIIVAEAHAFHEQMLREHPHRYHPGTRTSIKGGQTVSSAAYIQSRREMDRLRAESQKLFADVDVLITPTAPGPAFKFGAGRLAFLRNTAPWNLLGLPSVSIPCGFTANGLPIGLQITGAAGRDDVVIAAADAYQRVTDWHLRRPPLTQTASFH
ncbi:MAG TPA: amidase [Bryobacteraceae bacterium]|nr:amidase [Bryobacteraceae bacterium]